MTGPAGRAWQVSAGTELPGAIALDQFPTSSVAYYCIALTRENAGDMPVQITVWHMDTSDAVAARIRERAEELERFFNRIMSCRRRIACPGRQRHEGNLFRVSANF